VGAAAAGNGGKPVAKGGWTDPTPDPYVRLSVHRIRPSEGTIPVALGQSWRSLPCRGLVLWATSTLTPPPRVSRRPPPT